MDIRTRSGRTVQLRTAEFGTSDPLALRYLGFTKAGISVTDDKFFGLPAVSGWIRFASENVASAPMCVYDVTNPEVPVPRTDTWQYKLISNPPAEELTSFNLIGDIAANIEGYGNSFVRKIKVDGKVLDFQLLDPDRVDVDKDDGGNKIFRIKFLKGGDKTLGADEIIHFRGYTPKGGIEGMSPIRLYRESLGNVIAQSEFRGRFYKNNAVPGGYIAYPEGVELDDSQMAEEVAMWEEDHAGVDNSHRIALLTNGGKFQPIGINLKDAAFIEGMQFDVEEMARALNAPVEALTGASGQKTEEFLLKLVFGYLRPRALRIQQTFNADPDLFPEGSNLKLKLDYESLVRADSIGESAFLLRMRQGGILSANEARARLGYGPVDENSDSDYEIPIVIPVGAGTPPGEEPGPTVPGPDGEANQ